jgi:hypothetical protein
LNIRVLNQLSCVWHASCFARPCLSASMKTFLLRAVSLSLLLSIAAISGYAKTIKSVPFTIDNSGTYTLDKDLTLAGGTGTGITVNASNVVIDLGGFTLQSGASGNGIGISVSGTNVTIQNGTISEFNIDLFLQSAESLVQNLTIVAVNFGIDGEGCTDSVIQNCLVQGIAGTSYGVFLTGCSGILLTNNQMVSHFYCCESGSSSSDVFIGNFLGNADYGLYLDTGDKYAANVTTGCTTPFTGGVAVGDDNN